MRPTSGASTSGMRDTLFSCQSILSVAVMFIIQMTQRLTGLLHTEYQHNCMRRSQLLPVVMAGAISSQGGRCCKAALHLSAELLHWTISLHAGMPL